MERRTAFTVSNWKKTPRRLRARPGDDGVTDSEVDALRAAVGSVADDALDALAPDEARRILSQIGARRASPAARQLIHR